MLSNRLLRTSHTQFYKEERKSVKENESKHINLYILILCMSLRLWLSGIICPLIPLVTSKDTPFISVVRKWLLKMA